MCRGPWGRYAVCFRMLRAPEMSRLLPLVLPAEVELAERLGQRGRP